MTVKAGDRMEEVTVKVVSTVPDAPFQEPESNTKTEKVIGGAVPGLSRLGETSSQTHSNNTCK